MSIEDLVPCPKQAEELIAKHGGKREGAGRKHTGPLCACGKHSNKRAQALRLKCRIEPYLK